MRYRFIVRHRFLPAAYVAALAAAALALLVPASAHAQDDGPPPPDAMPASLDGADPQNETEAAAFETLEQFGRMWEEENMDTFDRIIAQDADMVVIGTDATEFIVGHDAFKKVRAEQYEAFENVEFNVESRSLKVSESGTVAWFTEQFDLFTVAEGAPVNLEGLRLSGVMEMRDGRWQIVQLHTSVPVPGRAVEY